MNIKKKKFSSTGSNCFEFYIWLSRQKLKYLLKVIWVWFNEGPNRLSVRSILISIHLAQLTNFKILFGVTAFFDNWFLNKIGRKLTDMPSLENMKPIHSNLSYISYQLHIFSQTHLYHMLLTWFYQSPWKSPQK